MSKFPQALRFFGAWALVGIVLAGGVLLLQNRGKLWQQLRTDPSATEQNARAEALPRSFADAVAAAAPAVVNIYTARVVTAESRAPESPLLEGGAPQVRQRVPEAFDPDET